MDIILQWAIDKVEGWRTLHPVLRFILVMTLFTLGVLFVVLEWRAAFLQPDYLYEMRLRDLLH